MVLLAIGSGGTYALAAARALVDVEGMDAEQIARKVLNSTPGLAFAFAFATVSLR
jgi:ATP-dependent HslUV protease subunit HslV